MPFFIRKNNTISKKMPFVVAKMQSKPACARGDPRESGLGGGGPRTRTKTSQGKKSEKYTHTPRERRKRREGAR